MKRFAVILIFCAAAAACGPDPGSNQADQRSEPPPVAFDGALVTEASARVAHGGRLTRVLGCTGCHGKALEGKVWVDSPEEGLLHSSNLTRALANYSDEQIRRLLLAGEHPSGRDVWGMPSEIFQYLERPDVDALIAYLRTVKPIGEPSPTPILGPIAKEGVAKGELKPAAQFVQETRNVGPADLGPSHALGRYITRVTCAECHGPELKGGGDMPDLIAAGAYNREEFERLITQGVPVGDRKLKPLMVSVARSRFSHLTPRERDALYAYLKARAEQPQ